MKNLLVKDRPHPLQTWVSRRRRRAVQKSYG